ncbi:hypothetical protein P7228_11555 [Altererythrobacter arenosus]|uniref:DUF4148 domain-containing protein n=1 Tax=Altererythrobacter arenosus TaxID=3032592 RepID=A0ABY8FNN2_9SPHN|nr:hypothetical protein [Altererythrobacter sp. CAU 1644]WFL76629.1 hypothetical protein P7228_11555 [Altererythrobacter sp. CAU 1644]
MTTRSAISALALSLACAGCSVADMELAGYQDPGFGEANRATYAAMVVNPDPKYDTPMPATSAQHAAQAIERYRTDAVKKPERITTTEAGSGN